MRLLKISVSGLPLFRNKCEIDFFALQRVAADDANQMNKLFSYGSQTLYHNNVMSFIGINASGKTTILKLITFVLRMLNNESINNIEYREILDGLDDNSEAVFDVYFYSDNKSVNMLHTVITRQNEKYYIKDEYLKSKSVTKIKNKNDVFVFDDCEPVVIRNNDEDFLLYDVSITVAFNKRNREQVAFTDMLQYTNINELSISENCPPELIAFFDPSVEYLNVKKSGKDTDIRLKFKGKDEIVLNQLSELNRYLSSGTIKGINTFLNAIKLFESGGYLIVDELENHFNREIVSTLIRFYMNRKVNPKGAMLVFSTHYSELLDEFERNDNIYIVRNSNGITAENLTTIINRNDIKKSEAYQSGYFGGTAPMYEAYMNLKRSFMRSRKEDM